MIVKNITDKISYIPSSEDPFTADVALIKTDDCIWIFDVGTTNEITDYINSLSGTKKGTIIQEEIKFFENRSAEFCALTHDPLYIVKKSKIIAKLKKIYEMREENCPEIKIRF